MAEIERDSNRRLSWLGLLPGISVLACWAWGWVAFVRPGEDGARARLAVYAGATVAVWLASIGVRRLWIEPDRTTDALLRRFARAVLLIVTGLAVLALWTFLSRVTG